MTDDPHRSGDTPTGDDPDARFDRPGYEDVSLGQAAERDAALADELVRESDDLGEAERRFADEATGAPALRERPAPPPDAPADPHRLLRIYLEDHHAGASAGVALARRAASANRGTEFEAPLAAIATALVEDREALEQVMRDAGFGPSRPKDALGAIGVAAGRLKPSGRLRGYSPLSRVLELEALAATVAATRRCWDVIELAGPTVLGAEVAPRTELSRLRRRADDQVEELSRQHRAAVAVAFGAADDTAGDVD